MLKFFTLDPRPSAAATNDAILAASPALGTEVTVPALAAQCSLGNIDPQHGSEPGVGAAIDAAWDVPLPPDGASLVTVRADLDSIGAMAVIALRAAGFVDPRVTEDSDWDPTGALLRRTFWAMKRSRDISAADCASTRPWPGLRPLPTVEDPWAGGAAVSERRDLAPLQAIAADHTRPMAERVTGVAVWLLYGETHSACSNGASCEQTDGCAERAKTISAIGVALGCDEPSFYPDDMPSYTHGQFRDHLAQRFTEARKKADAERLDMAEALAEGQRNRGCLCGSGPDHFDMCTAIWPPAHQRPICVYTVCSCGMQLTAVEASGDKFGEMPCPGCSGPVEHRIAAVESTHRGAMGIGYCLAPIVIAVNPEFAFDPGPTHRKITIARWSEATPLPGGRTMRHVADRLNADMRRAEVERAMAYGLDGIADWAHQFAGDLAQKAIDFRYGHGPGLRPEERDIANAWEALQMFAGGTRALRTMLGQSDASQWRPMPSTLLDGRVRGAVEVMVRRMPAWGGSSTIIGSPQGVHCETSVEDVIRVIRGDK